MDRELDAFDMKKYVKANCDVADYVNKHIVPSVHYRGSNRPIKEKQPILCPFHADTKPSFYYHYDEKYKKEKFKCFGCGLGGDVIDLHRFWSFKCGRKISFKQAVVELYNELQHGGR